MSVIKVEDYGEPNKNQNVAGNGTTRVNFILDETGSMRVVKNPTISGFNEYVQTLQKQTENVVMTLAKFNSGKGVQIEYINKPIGDVPELTDESYIPDCTTPLYDAIGDTIRRAEEEASEGDNVLVIIQTDGEENASKEYSLNAVKSLIKEKEGKGWTFAYLGADQNAWLTGGKVLGLSRGNTMSYRSGDTRHVFGDLAKASVSYCCSAEPGGQSVKNFFDGSATEQPKKKKKI